MAEVFPADELEREFKSTEPREIAYYLGKENGAHSVYLAIEDCYSRRVFVRCNTPSQDLHFQNDNGFSEKRDVTTREFDLSKAGRSPTEQQLDQLRGIANSVESDDNGNIVYAGFYNLRNTDSQLSALQGITTVERISIYLCDLTDNGLRLLSQMGLPNLDALQITSPADLSNAGLEHLEKMVTLETISLSHCHFDDAGLDHLKRMPSLKKIQLKGNRLSKDPIESLQDAIPGCVIET